MSDYDKSLHRHDKNRKRNHGKQRLKRWVFRRLRKTVSEGADVMCGGRPFQIRAAAIGKARYGVCSNLASSGELPASRDHFNHWLTLRLTLTLTYILTMISMAMRRWRKIAWSRSNCPSLATENNSAVGGRPPRYAGAPAPLLPLCRRTHRNVC